MFFFGEGIVVPLITQRDRKITDMWLGVAHRARQVSYTQIGKHSAAKGEGALGSHSVSQSTGAKYQHQETWSTAASGMLGSRHVKTRCRLSLLVDVLEQAFSAVPGHGCEHRYRDLGPCF